MTKYNDIIMGRIGGIKNTILGKIVLSVHAEEATEPTNEPKVDEPVDPTDTEPTAPSFNLENLLAKVRKEEKDKQYKVIERLKKQNKTLLEQHNTDLLRIGELEQSTDTKTARETIQRLETKVTELTAELEGYKNNPAPDKATIEAEIRAQLEAEYEVKNHRIQILAQHKDEVLVPELVVGNTVEELDASLQKAIDRSNEIRGQLGGSRKSRSTPKSPSNPSTGGQGNEVSFEYLATLDPASPEYAETRRKLGLR